MLMSAAELEDCIRRYNELLLRSDELEKDMPPRRKTDAVGKKAPETAKRTAKLVKKQAEVPAKKEPVDRTRRLLLRRCKTRGSQDEEDVEVKREEDVEVKPVQKKERKRRVSKVEQHKMVEPARLKFRTPAKVAVKKEVETKPSLLKLKVRTFEDHLIVNLTYSDLIKAVKEDEGKTVDFGMLLNLFPKNLEYEKNRFSIEDKSEFNTLLQRRHSFSDDIDKFFRLLSENPATSPSTEIPLV